MQGLPKTALVWAITTCPNHLQHNDNNYLVLLKLIGAIG